MLRSRLSWLTVAGMVFASSLACSLMSLPGTPTQPVVVPSATAARPVEVTAAPNVGEQQPGTPASPDVPAGSQVTPTAPVTAPPLVTSSEEQQLIDLYARVNGSVVAILVELGGAGFSQGSGFVYDEQGRVVTNQHVVEGATAIEVDFASGFKARGTVLGVDPHSDLAVIQVNGPPEQFVPLPLADSDTVQVGQRVVAIGNPFGLAGTMTVGIVSGLGRTLSGNAQAPGGGTFSAPDIIQTDAAINPGNSGGPLLNLSGQVVGINRAIESESGVNSGVGFAVASNTVRQVVPYLIEEGRYVYPYLGITSREEITLAMQELLDLPQATGAYVTEVVPGGPSDRAGLRGDSSGSSFDLRGDGDLIVAVDGIAVNVFSDLMSYLVNHTRPGQTIVLTVLRQGQLLDIEVVLGERP